MFSIFLLEIEIFQKSLIYKIGIKRSSTSQKMTMKKNTTKTMPKKTKTAKTMKTRISNITFSSFVRLKLFQFYLADQSRILFWFDFS